MTTAPDNKPRAQRPSAETLKSTVCRPGARPFPFAAILFLLVTAAISQLWSQHKLMSQDEIFVLQTDGVASIAQLIRIQHTTPISLDPLVYHLLAHGALRLFGTGAFAIRLPALLGFLLMQVCLFIVVRRTAGERAGVVALTFPAMTATLFYSAEGRPYGLLLGLYALVFVAWQTAIRGSTGGQEKIVERRFNRTGKSLWALVILAVTIALTLNTHYFGILLLIPLCTAELCRTIQRRRLDTPVVTAIVLGVAGVGFALPFQRSAGEFRQHYYNGGTVGLRAITQSYRALFVDYTHASLATQHVAAVGFVILALVFLAILVYRFCNYTLAFPFPEAVFTFTLAALPFFGFLLARFVIHSIEARFVSGAIIGVTVLLAMVLAPLLRQNSVYHFTLGLLLTAVVLTGLWHIHGEICNEKETLASLAPSSSLKAAIIASPAQLLYIQDMGHFEVASYYEPDAVVRTHMALLYSREQELRWDGHNTVSLTAMHMRAFTGFPIVAYEDLKQQPGPHVLVLFHSGWDWTDQALAEDRAEITPLGVAIGGDAVSVRFLQQTKTASVSH